VAGYFEIDFPAITSQKVSILKRKRELFGLASSDISWVREECHADNYHLIASDLRQWQSECVEKLHQSGLDSS
jgi:hypothetical protein